MLCFDKRTELAARFRRLRRGGSPFAFHSALIEAHAPMVADPAARCNPARAGLAGTARL